jgi:hypothetical protein
MATTHKHYCICGDYRVCSKDCNPHVREHRDAGAWVCPDCDVAEKLDALYAVELARLDALAFDCANPVNAVNRVLDQQFPINQGAKK